MRPVICAACRRPSETRLCRECAGDDRRTFALGCERCGEEFTARDETYRFCWTCFKALNPTLAELIALTDGAFDGSDAEEPADQL